MSGNKPCIVRFAERVGSWAVFIAGIVFILLSADAILTVLLWALIVLLVYVVLSFMYDAIRILLGVSND